jgi:hypothetical protein
MARRRLDRAAGRIGRRMATAAATPRGGQCHTDPAHVLAVFQTLIECGAWSIEEAAARVGLSSDEIRDALRDAGDIPTIGTLPPKG